MNPYNENINGNILRRTFSKDVLDKELTWHRDHEDRIVIPINENDWYVQFDNELPKKLNIDEEFFIPKNTFHRVIKGSSDLVVEIIETTFEEDEILEVYEVIEEGKKKKKKKKKKKDACYYKVRSRYDVWPSAYASGALVKCRKVGAKNWGNSTDESENKLEEEWSEKYKKSIDCNNPKGFSQKAHCQGRKKHDESVEELQVHEAKKTDFSKNINVYIGGRSELKFDAKYLWTTTNKDTAKWFGEFVYLLEVKINNPLIVDAKGANYDDIKTPKVMKDVITSNMKSVDTDLIVEFAFKNGYESCIIKNVFEGTGNSVYSDIIIIKPNDVVKTIEKFKVITRVLGGAQFKDLVKYDKNSEDLTNEAKKTDFSKEKSKGLHGWFERQGGKGKSKGWVDCNTCKKDPETGRKKCKSCGRKEGEKRKYPACRPTPASCGTKGKGVN